MKFDVTKVAQGCRTGLLMDIASNPDHVIKTPACMLYTRGGSAPYLSKDMMQYIQHCPDIIQMPLSQHAEHQEIITNYKKGVKSFTGMQGRFVSSCVQDPVQTIASGYNDTHGVSVWTKGGRLKLEVENFMSLQESLQPDMYEMLSDNDTPKDASKKRLKKSLDRSQKFLEQCIEKHEKSDLLKKTGMLGVACGGHSESERELSAKMVAKFPLHGFVIGGLHGFGMDTEKLDYLELKPLIDASVRNLPSDKMRILYGILNPLNVMKVIRSGIDVIDSTYPYVITERGEALTFDYRSDKDKECGDGSQSGYGINMNDKSFSDDLDPLLSWCSCYTCSHHSKAYINHLLNTKELLGQILLTIHNFSHYFGFVAAVRESIENDRFEELYQKITQLHS